jgi:iron(III) transport system ATP-binding protein
MNVLSVVGLSKVLGDVEVVKSLDLTLQQGQKLGIVGETGSGKSSVLKMISGLMQPSTGEVWYQQKRVKGPDEQLIAGHPQIGYLSQHFELRNNYRVHELLNIFNKLEPEEAQQIYALCQIEPFLQRWTDELSGGERQRVALAKILINKPQLLCLDEPFSNLDVLHKIELQRILQQLFETLSLSCIMVSHDATELLPWADELYIMRAGQVLQQGPPRLLYHQPNHPYCAGLLGTYNLLDAHFECWPQLQAIQQQATQWMVRPEAIELGSHGNIVVAGTVTYSHFMGAFNQIAVQLQGGGSLLVNIGLANIKPGSLLQLSIDEEHLHPFASFIL